MPQRLPDFPEDLLLFSDLITEHMRKAAVLVENKNAESVPAMGYTHTMGMADFPADAEWTKPYSRECQSPLDGPSFWLQVNLEEIPGQARTNPAVPSTGCLWLFLDLTGSLWKGTVYFDPRPAAMIPWMPRDPRQSVTGTSLHLVDVPAESIAALEHVDEGLLEIRYSDYASQMVPKGKPYFGGYAWAIQGDEDLESHDTIFCTMNDQFFGDNGAIYIHYSAEKGWWVNVETH